MKTVPFRLAAAAILLSLATPLLHAQPDAQPDRIIRPVDRSRVVVLSGGVNPNARPADDQGVIDPSTEIAYATLYLKPSDAQQAELEKLLAGQQDPGSPDFRRWLAPEEYADRFGLSRGDIAKLTAWLGSEGLRVNDVARGRRWITFSGSAGSVGGAFHTELHRYVTGSETHFANVTAPSIPDAFADVVAAVGGLDDYDLLPAYGKNPRVAAPDNSTASGAHFLSPSDISTIYDLGPLGLDGTGQKFAVIGNADLNLTDIHNFRNRFNLPANDPQQLLVGPDPMSTLRTFRRPISISNGPARWRPARR